MREIKFRAWSKYKNLMGEVTGFRFSKSQYPFVNVRFKENGKIVDEGYHFGQEDGCDNVILMQFTGLQDKNGKEIYEGDVLLWGDDNRQNQVVFSQGSFQMQRYGGLAPLRYHNLINSEAMNAEVIGNIYENPDLIEGGAE